METVDDTRNSDENQKEKKKPAAVCILSILQ